MATSTTSWSAAAAPRPDVWAGRGVVLGVSGGIASYKSCLLARGLTQAGARVDVVLTKSAAEFVGPVTFEALTGRPVLTSLWESGTRAGSRAPAAGHRPHHRGARHGPPGGPHGPGPGRRCAHRAAARPHRPRADRSRHERRDVRPARDAGEPRAPPRAGGRDRGTGGRCAGGGTLGAAGPDERAGGDPGPRGQARTPRRRARRQARGRDRGADARVDRPGARGDQPLERQDGIPSGGGRLGAGRGGGAHLRAGVPGSSRRRRASTRREHGGSRRRRAPRAARRRRAHHGGRAGRFPSQRPEREQAIPRRRRAGDTDGADRGHPERHAGAPEGRAASSSASRWRRAMRWPRGARSWSARISTSS